jgi:uncharacterized membrane protein YhaH (DUF805 family)
MDWTWFLFSFEGRIDRAKFWLAAFIRFATVFSFMTIFLFVVAGILRASGTDFHSVSTRTMHPAFYLPGFPLFVIGVWLFAATSIKRLHDRGKTGWWLAPFFHCSGPARQALGLDRQPTPGTSCQRAQSRRERLVLCRTVLPGRKERA